MKNELEPYLNLSLQDMEGEEWRDITDFIGYYQISNLGRVKSLKRVVEVKNNPRYSEMKVKEIIKKQFFLRRKKKFFSDILMVKLHIDGKDFSKQVSRLVGNAFLTNSKNHRYLLHKGNILNNSVENLFWGNEDNLSDVFHKAKKNPTSKYKGVHKRNYGYVGKIVINKTLIRQSFKSELEAAKKYDYYVKKYKLNRELNFPDE